MQTHSEVSSLAWKSPGLEAIRKWFKHRGWKPQPFQEETWQSYLQGESGLLQVPTGSGKTYAAFMGPLAELIDRPVEGLTILYVTPLRALSRDIEKALALPVEEMGLGVRVESRTGDSKGSLKARQRKKAPQILVTTPESLSVLISYPEAREFFAGVRSIIVDEWHELLGSKRGVQTELAIARLKAFVPSLRVWALSATIENPQDAARVATQIPEPRLIRSGIRREVKIETLLPEKIDTFPWAGHLGIFMARHLVEHLDPDRSTLIFTNTRAQAERWYEEIIKLKPEWLEITALHHGSIERETREDVEEAVKNGDIKFVVCTSSLDLGIDFAPVERVVQIGSPKGIARLTQRAGRAAHRPGETAHVIFVPTHALEILEVNALRKALVEGLVEPRVALTGCVDVLAQHLVTVAMGGGFRPEAMYEEVRRTHAFGDLTRAEFDEVLEFVVRGGKTLVAYPQFHKVSRNDDGLYEVNNSFVAKLHRLNIGTISTGSSVTVAYLKGTKIGSVEEAFAARLKPGDVFHFAGKKLEFIRLHQLVCQVKPAPPGKGSVPSWAGSRQTLSTHLSDQMRQSFQNPAYLTDRERKRAEVLLEAQASLSANPREDRLLAETFQSREGRHLFVFPFEGRHVHEGLAAVLATRFGRIRPGTFSLSVNDYGFEIMSDEEYPFGENFSAALFDPVGFEEDLMNGVNLVELSRRQFRGISQVAGLIFQGYPGQQKSTRQVQVSSQLLFDVFTKHDPDHFLLREARREALREHLESQRLRKALERLHRHPIELYDVPRPTPLGFPLLVERLAARVSNESLLERVERMKRAWEKWSPSPGKK